VGGSGDCLGGEVELSVIRITMEAEAMAPEDLSKGKDVQDEEKRSEHRTLGDTVSDWSRGGFAIVYGDVLLPV